MCRPFASETGDAVIRPIPPQSPHGSYSRKTSGPLRPSTNGMRSSDTHTFPLPPHTSHACVDVVTGRTRRTTPRPSHSTHGSFTHALVRAGAIAGTLAIDEVRAHGGDKALERIVSDLAKAKEAGNSKVTKKHLTGSTSTSKPAAPTAPKINDACAKQLLQALQAVRHDPVFGKLSPGTIRAVHTALSPLKAPFRAERGSVPWRIG